MLTLENIKPPKREFWVNVYKYPKHKFYIYSHYTTLRNCERLQHAYESDHRKTLYRIHVKLKDEF